MDEKTKSYLILGVWSGIVLFTYFFLDKISSYMGDSGFFLALGLYLLFNPLYFLLVYGIFKTYAHRSIFKRAIASLLLVLAGDIYSFPRMGITDSLNGSVSANTNLEVIVMKAMETHINHSFAFFIIYVAVPIVFVGLALELLGVTNFIREIKRGR